MEEKKSTGIGKVLGKIVGGLGKGLTILFCVLRACDVIQWEWYWVMTPFFAVLGLSIIGFIIVGAAAAAVIDS